MIRLGSSVVPWPYCKTERTRKRLKWRSREEGTDGKTVVDTIKTEANSSCVLRVEHQGEIL